MVKFLFIIDKQPINSEILLESIQVFFVDITSALIKFINSDGEPIKDIVWSAEKIEAVIKECIPFPNFEEGQNDEGHVAVLKARIYSLITFHRVFSILLNQIQEKDNKMEELFTSFKKLEEENALLKDILSASQTVFLSLTLGIRF